MFYNWANHYVFVRILAWKFVGHSLLPVYTGWNIRLNRYDTKSLLITRTDTSWRTASSCITDRTIIYLGLSILIVTNPNLNKSTITNFNFYPMLFFSLSTLPQIFRLEFNSGFDFQFHSKSRTKHYQFTNVRE